MKDCIFCHIVHNKIPCVRVYETEDVLAFLDVSPAVKGHTLVIPKKHAVNIMDLPLELAPELQKAVQKVGQGFLKGLGAEGFNLGMNNFEAAGQLVMHAHYHLIPRYAGDGLKLWPQGPYEDNEEMHILARNIRDGIPGG
jgi:histidine triad (HIT) family protein